MLSRYEWLAGKPGTTIAAQSKICEIWLIATPFLFRTWSYDSAQMLTIMVRWQVLATKHTERLVAPRGPQREISKSPNSNRSRRVGSLQLGKVRCLYIGLAVCSVIEASLYRHVAVRCDWTYFTWSQDLPTSILTTSLLLGGPRHGPILRLDP